MAGAKRGGQGGRANKPGSHRKGPSKGSGGESRRALRGRGPTPPAERRPGHPAQRRAAAAARRDERRLSGAARPEMVVGRNAVVEALRAGAPAKALYVAERVDMDDRVRESVQLSADGRITVLEVPRPELDRLTGGAPHQGIALQVPPYEYAHPDDLLKRVRDLDETPLLVALDGVTDPRNLGAVVRSVAAFGGHGVVVPERRAAGVTAVAWKASAGTIARVQVARATNLTRTLRAYKAEGLMVVGLDGGAPEAIDSLDVSSDAVVLVVGAEGRGLSRLVRETCDLVVHIPISGAESLNASVAAGIALYEVARSRSR